MVFRTALGRWLPKSVSSSSGVGKDNWFSGGVMVRSRPRKSIVVMELLHYSFALTKTNVIIDIELLLSILFGEVPHAVARQGLLRRLPHVGFFQAREC